MIAVISPLMGHSITITLKYLWGQTKGLICAGVAAGIGWIDGWRERMLQVYEDEYWAEGWGRREEITVQ